MWEDLVYWKGLEYIAENRKLITSICSCTYFPIMSAFVLMWLQLAF